MNIPSFHQHDLFSELTKKYDTFEVVFAHSQDKNRINQGWNFEKIKDYESKTIGMDLSPWALIPYVLKNRKATHIVNGIWAEKSFLFVLILLNIFRSNFLIYSEAPVPSKKRNFIKTAILKFMVKPFAELLIIRAKGFLAVSVFAVEYFKSLGAKSAKIYRFGYFRTVKNLIQNPSNKKYTELIFVGQLIERKGISTLLEAIEVVTKANNNFHLTVIGTGKLKPVLKEFINQNHLQNTVTLLGVINAENITDYLEKADLLILPSIFDGWGMVVNEALQSHIPVLVSDKCGAKELVKHQKNGLIFEGNDIKSLIENIQFFLQLSPAEKDVMKNYASDMGEKISIPIVSNYLSLCVNHCLRPQTIKPNAPWLDE